MTDVSTSADEIDPPEETGEMAPDLLKRIVESLLFTADNPVTIGNLRNVLEVPRRSLESALDELAADCEGRGVRLQRNGDEVQMVTAPEVASYVERFFGIGGANKLSNAALETLAIIAYHQPVTRAQLEAIRGVNSDYTISVLEARSLIVETGRLATPGRPALFGTTMEFLKYLGMSGLSELPHPEIRNSAQTDMFDELANSTAVELSRTEEGRGDANGV